VISIVNLSHALSLIIAYISLFPIDANSNYKSNHPCCNAAQKMKKRLSTSRSSSRGE
jgi:hypothetical protein